MDFPEPWAAITDAETRRAIQDELRLELPRDHLLTDEPAEAVARREDRDEVLFALSGHRWAIVHLTWRQARESDPGWPRAAVFRSDEDLAARLRDDHREFK